MEEIDDEEVEVFDKFLDCEDQRPYEGHLNRERVLKLFDLIGEEYEVSYVVSKSRPHIVPDEKEGLKLLVGRYVMYDQKVAYVKSLNSNGNMELIEVLSKKEHTVQYPDANLQLIERFGVNIF